MKQKSIIISVKALDLKSIIPMVMMILMFNINIQSIHSQTTLKYSNQGFRAGDKLVKQQVRYKNPGRTGKDVIWDFSNLKEISGSYTVNYNETTRKSKDTIFVSGTEHQTKYTYAYKSDSLLLLGFENPTSGMTFEKPQLLMKYPFIYGDSVFTGYSGKGSYNFTLLSETKGNMFTVADAVGTLILPDGDTVKDVLRVRTEHIFQQNTLPMELERQTKLPFDDSITVIDTKGTKSFTVDSVSISQGVDNYKNNGIAEQPDVKGNSKSNNNALPTKKITRGKMLKENTDSLYFHTVTCRWYAPGYRYPLFETISNQGLKNKNDSTGIDDVATAFYYPPFKQKDLNDDPENKTVLDSLMSQKEDEGKEKELSLKFNYYPNPVKNDLQVEILIQNPSKVTIRIAGSSGNIMLSESLGMLPAGMHYYTLKTGKLRMGEYILHIEVAGQTASAILLKL